MFISAVINPNRLIIIGMHFRYESIYVLYSIKMFCPCGMFKSTVSLNYVIHDINRHSKIKNLFDRPIFFCFRSKGQQFLASVLLP